MVSSLLNASLAKPSSATSISTSKFRIPSLFCEELMPPICRKSELSNPRYHGQKSSQSPPIVQIVLQKSLIPLAASLAIVFWSNSAHAGLLSGLPGIESVPGPQLPQIDFLSRFNGTFLVKLHTSCINCSSSNVIQYVDYSEDNQKKYAENDARFKESPLLKKLLEKTELNREKNRQSILDKYCIRGAEWGVGDCSTEGMSPDERDKFIAMLKQKAGVE